jgi:NAD(P)-dependent dehydrogenase (short-subunit alcohol dehydrogenase family)
MRIVITGGLSGIGLALANYFFERGHEVHVTSRSAQSHNKFKVHQLDLSHSQSIQNFVDGLRLEKIDMLINNAGSGVLGPLTELSRDQARAQFETNVFGPMELVSKLLPRLLGGHLVNISSISPEINLPFGGIYTASKAAMNSLSDIWRLELAHMGIRVTTVRPGLINTNFAKNADQDFLLSSSSLFNKFKASILERAKMSQQGTDPRVFAEHVGPKLLSNHSPPIIYFGKGSFIYPLLVKVLPYKLQFRIILNKYRLT